MTKEDMAKKLLRSLGAVDEDMVAEAAPGKRPKKRHLRIRYLVAEAAAVAVVVGVGIVLYTGLNGNGIRTNEVNELADIDTAYSGADGEGEVDVENGSTQEDGKTDEQQETGIVITIFQSDRSPYEVWYGDEVYTESFASVDEARIGDDLGEVTVTSQVWGGSEDTIVESSMQACEITGIQAKCALAVWIEDEYGERYEAFYNSAYLPATLGEFVEDLNLREDLSLGMVYSYADSEQTAKYSGVDEELIWKLLFSNTEAEASQCDDISGGRVMSIRIDMPILGCTNLAITVTEDGYLKTNLLATGKAFYIGEEAVEQFVEHVMNNYEGVAETEALESYTILEEADPEEIVTTVEGGVLPPFIPDDGDAEEIVTAISGD
ncbi:MAG: hypothetical protein LUE29_09145 [Lachnospiraceae bacterium]|nr:hypothetical protein [Lachnospiraceae bacterium]